MKIAMISSWHVHAKGYAEKFAAMPQVEITAVWDENKEAGLQWAKELGCNYIEDYDLLMKDSSIDGIVMGAPTSMHGELLLKAAQAGKHIFTEKVLTITTEESIAIQKAVEENHVCLTIAFPHECRADVLFAKEMLEKGGLGEITYARVRNAHNGSSAGWLPPHFYDEQQCGGGAMIDLGSHTIYLLEWLLGKPKNIISCFTNVTDKPVEDNAVCVMEFAKGAIGVAETSFVAQNNPFTLELCGTKGSLMVRDGVTYANSETDGKWVTATELPKAWPNPLEQWVGAITEKRENHLGIEAAVSLTSIMEGAYKAWRTEKKYTF